MQDKTNLQRFLKNSSWIVGGKIFQMVLSLLISTVTARYLGPSNYGLIGYAASFVAFFTPACTLGLECLMVNEIINHREQTGAIVGTSIIMRITTSVCSVFGVVVVVFFLNMNERDTLVVTALYSLSLVFQCFDSISYYFQADMQSKYSTIATSVAYIVMSAYKIVLLVLQKDIRFFAFSYALDQLVIAALLLFIYIRRKGPRLCFSWELGKSLVARSYHFILSGLMVAVYGQTDKIMLKAMLNSEAVGFYSTGVAVCNLWVFLLAAIIESARPLILEKKKTSNEEYENGLVMLYSAVIGLSSVVAILFTIFAEPIILILYGQAYLPAANCLRVLTWATMFSYLGVSRSIWMVAEGRQKHEKRIAAFGAICNVIMNIVLIRLVGVLGAAIATLCTQMFTNFIVGFFVRDIRRNSELILKGFDLRPWVRKFIQTSVKAVTDKELISSAFSMSRIIAIIAVVSAHINISEYPILNCAYGNIGICGVAAFLIISGYYYKKYSFRTFLHKKMYSIVIPWIFLGTVVYIFAALVNRNPISIVQWLLWIVGYKTYLYYVVIILLCYVVFYLSCPAFDIMAVCTTCISLCFTQSGLLEPYLHFLGITNYLNVFNWVGFFAIGRILHRVPEQKLTVMLEKTRNLAVIVWLFVFSVLLFKNTILTYFSLSGALFSILSAWTIFSVSTIGCLQRLPIKTLSGITYSIYLLHMMFVGIVEKMCFVYVTSAVVTNIAVVIVTAFVLGTGYLVSYKLKISRVYVMLVGMRTPVSTKQTD